MMKIKKIVSCIVAAAILFTNSSAIIENEINSAAADIAYPV